MTEKQAHFEYILRMGDDALILGQRLSEWCGHGPVLEQDIAVTNIALDLIGQARSILEYAGQIENKGRSEDDLAFLRDAWDFRNALIVEQPNRDWAHTIVRQFLFDAFHFLFLREISGSHDEQLAAIAAKSLKEVTYHLRFSSEWVIRLGDGTGESRRRMQEAVNTLWPFTGELFEKSEVDHLMIKKGKGVDPERLKPEYQEKIATVFREATLSLPEDTWMQSGGRSGRHSEHLGYILAEMQFLQRAYPGLDW